MERVPSIHITERDLVSVLQEAFDGAMSKKEVRDLARDVVSLAKTKSCSSRILIASNEKLYKKSEKIKLEGRGNTSAFAQSLLIMRRKYKHRGIQLIKPGSDQWLQLKEVCKLATEFCNEFQLKTKDGYNKYCEIAMGMMKSFSLNKFRALHAGIILVHEAQIEIAKDKWSVHTEFMIRYYLKKVNEKIGWVSEDYKSNPTKYVCFIRAREEADRIGIDIKTYIDAQFAGMEWANAIPDPLQLYGEKACGRVMKYCYENNIKIKEHKKKLDFKKIKQNGKSKNNNK